MEQLTGKDNKKARNAKSREVSDMKKTDDFVDAERVRTDFARALRLFCFLLPQYERNFTWTCDLVWLASFCCKRYAANSMPRATYPCARATSPIPMLITVNPLLEVIAGKEPLQEKWKGEAKVEKKEEIVLEVVDKTAYVTESACARSCEISIIARHSEGCAIHSLCIWTVQVPHRLHLGCESCDVLSSFSAVIAGILFGLGKVAPTSITKDKKEKKEKKPESAGISPAERDELEKLKVEIVAQSARGRVSKTFFSPY